MAIESVNPTTGARGPLFEALTESELEDKLARAHAAFATWSRTPVSSRAAVVAHAGEILAKDAAVRRMSGQPAAAGEAEVMPYASL